MKQKQLRKPRFRVTCFVLKRQFKLVGWTTFRNLNRLTDQNKIISQSSVSDKTLEVNHTTSEGIKAVHTLKDVTSESDIRLGCFK
jgi:hypothetical protein